jgi:hypothetical protein
MIVSVPGKIATSQETLVALLESSKRSALPLRHTFVQTRGPKGAASGGPLAAFVRAHHERALDQYLLLHALASGDDFGVARPAKVWARALAFGVGSSGLASVSKNWGWLESRNLIERSRYGRWSKPVLLREDGSGRPYLHPSSAGKKANERYFKVPYSYWLESWHLELGLAAKAVLLIALSLSDDFILPVDHASAWYGLSADTLNRGLLILRKRRLLTLRRQQRAAPFAPEGYTWEHRYTLAQPFGPRGRPKVGSA